MSIGSLASLAGSYLQSIVSPAFQSAGLTATPNSLNAGSTGSSQSDTGQLSPFAQLLNTLQQLQQSNAAQYQQVTRQISANLQSASQTAQANGNTTAASELSTLSTDFKTASQNGQLPDVQDLAQAMGGHHHHHHAQPSANPSGNSSASNSSNEASQLIGQLFGSLQSGGTANASTDPESIILNTLSGAGVSGA
jgi:hypothetical protein